MPPRWKQMKLAFRSQSQIEIQELSTCDECTITLEESTPDPAEQSQQTESAALGSSSSTKLYNSQPVDADKLRKKHIFLRGVDHYGNDPPNIWTGGTLSRMSPSME